MNLFKYLSNRQYRLFRRKIKDVQASIWEYEFKIAKSRQVREGVRQDRDHAIEAVNNIANMLKADDEAAIADKMPEDARKNLVDEMTKLNDDTKRYEAQMRMIDDQINGVNASAESSGTQGIMETIKAMVELKSMYKDYSNKL